MFELERIDQALAQNDLDPALFEQCAQDLLMDIFPGLSPIPGGSDFGRDADLHGGNAAPPPRLMVTKSRDRANIRRNMLDGLDSLASHDIPFRGIVLANPGRLSETQREHLRADAASRGAELLAVYDREFFSRRLRRDGEWRQRLLGLSPEPITLSLIPWRLEDSPGAGLPLVGREAALSELQDRTEDIILTGAPGVGKTRLLAELPNAYFVASDADHGRLADDIRWLAPQLLVLDDVGQAPDLAEFLQRLRRQEADLLSFRLVIVCWPDELASVRDLAPAAMEIELGLLERQELDQIIRSMGIGGLVARQAILDQCEGRAGWAVALADLLLQSGWDDLVTGRALLGQVDHYLRRLELGSEARRVLSAIAALRGIDESEMSILAEGVGGRRDEIVQVVRAVAQGGLLDIGRRHTSEGPIRAYTVRPPMLADAIAAEYFYSEDVPLGDVENLITHWPHKRLKIVQSACTAARLGSRRARAVVDTMVSDLQAAPLRADERRELFESYLLIDEDSGARVVKWIADEFAALTDEEKADGFACQPIVELAFAAAARFLNREAVQLLIEIAAHDSRETNPHPHHPLKKLGELCTYMHPDFPPNLDRRILVAEIHALSCPANHDDSAWRVWAAIAGQILTPHLSGVVPAPEDAFRFSIVSTIVPTEYADLISERLWPTVAEQLQAAPRYVIAEFVSVAHEWLRVGRGFDRPFGNEHSAELLVSADAIGRRLLGDLCEICESSPGLLRQLSWTAGLFDIELPMAALSDLEMDPFFRDVGHAHERDEAIAVLEHDIEVVVTDWAIDSPQDVIAKLLELRAELAIARIYWPNRTTMACSALLTRIEDIRTWVATALDHDLFPDALPMLEAWVVGDPGPDLILLGDCFQNGAARQCALSVVLASSTDDSLLTSAIQELHPIDFDMLDMLLIRKQLTLGIQRRILTEAVPGVRGAFAIALFDHGRATGDSIPEDLREAFLNAVLDMRPAELRGHATHELAELAKHLAVHYPDNFEALIRRLLEENPDGALVQALSYEVWDSLHLLHVANKTSLLSDAASPVVRWLLIEHLVGTDTEWLAAELDAGRVSPEEALGAFTPGGGISIEDMAMLLVPRGIDPKSLAGRASLGSYSGSRSSHYSRIVDSLAPLLESEDQNVAAVGRAGVEMFSAARDEALETERRQRIRGQM